MIVLVLTTCHTQYTWDSSRCIFLFNITTLQVFVTYLTGALCVHPLWFYKHQHDNRVHSTQNAFSLPLAAILVNCAPSGEMHNYCTRHIIEESFENFLIHPCNYILLSRVYCVWQVVKTPTIIFNNPLYSIFWDDWQLPTFRENLPVQSSRVKQSSGTSSFLGDKRPVRECRPLTSIQRQV